MVQKKKSPESAHVEPRRRGRPRAYDHDAALDRALERFWAAGYAATSLDDLSAATGMNRPSLYAAFGDKQAIYRQAYERYRKTSAAAMGDAFTVARPLPAMLRVIFERAVDLYLGGAGAPRGCFSVLTAASDAVVEPQVCALVVESVAGLDRIFRAVLAKGVEAGELPADADVDALATLSTATLHTLSIRARAGVPRADLMKVVDAAVSTLCAGR